jgi:hypothetical protein
MTTGSEICGKQSSREEVRRVLSRTLTQRRSALHRDRLLAGFSARQIAQSASLGSNSVNHGVLPRHSALHPLCAEARAGWKMIT